MKKTISLILALILCLSLCACGETKVSPKERLNDEVKEYISENFHFTIGGSTSKTVNVEIDSVVDMEENKWAVIGIYTVKIENKVMSAEFRLEATYDETSDKFIYSQEEFDDFK